MNDSRSSAPFRIKICGITQPEQARQAAAAGADAIGLNFYGKSPRYVSLAAAKEIAGVCSGLSGRPVIVGVFVNESIAAIREIAAAVDLDFVQLHGDEGPDVIADLQPLRVIRAFRLSGDNSREFLRYLDQCRREQAIPSAVLVDAFRPGEYGGTGAAVDWSAARKLKEQIAPLPLILAGGLTAENVAAAIREVDPAGVDTASGVESFPGIKDRLKVAAFCQAASAGFDPGRSSG